MPRSKRGCPTSYYEEYLTKTFFTKEDARRIVKACGVKPRRSSRSLYRNLAKALDNAAISLEMREVAQDAPTLPEIKEALENLRKQSTGLLESIKSLNWASKGYLSQSKIIHQDRSGNH